MSGVRFTVTKAGEETPINDGDGGTASYDAAPPAVTVLDGSEAKSDKGG